jgi:O-antigen/teichoic acid export membrane protein
LLATIPAAFALIAVAPFALPGLFGADFDGAVPDLQILTFGVLGIILIRLPGNALAARGRPGLQSLGMGMAFAVTVVLDILLIPPFGGAGAAAASLMAYTAGGVVMSAVFMRLLRVPGRALLPTRTDLVDAVAFGRDLAARHSRAA